jgi:NADH-quinone oxidoreductase subunit G
VAGGTVKGIIGIEADIPPSLLAGMTFVASMDWLPTALAERADVFLPTTAWVEMDGTYVNNEGRAQRFKRVMRPGLPIKGLDPALHPPRVHRTVPPGGSLLPAWQAVGALLEKLGEEPVSEPLDGEWKHLRMLDPEGEGTVVTEHKETLP